MLRIFIVALIVTFIVELWLLITVGQWIGAAPTIAMVILTALLGAWLAKREGLQTLQAVRFELEQNRMPSWPLIDGICIFIGALALLLPGFLTDICGLLLLIPYTRNIFKAWLRARFEKWIAAGRFTMIKR